MPTISRFFGVVVSMNHGDHAPPHFHAKYGGAEALIAIDGPVLIRGRLPPRILGFVVEWAVLHRAELQDDWERASRLEPLLPIDPLE